MIVNLHDRGLIGISGPDAWKFLQDLVTADVPQPAEEKLVYAGLLTPQGKILFDFFILCDRQGYRIDCPLQQRDQLLKRLMFYKLRAKLDITTLDDAITALIGEPAGGAISDPRTDDMGARLYGSKREGRAALEDYHMRRIALGLAEAGSDYASGELFPHEANFDQIGAISFRKGCFVGQEVVSRIEHRGTARSRILPCRVKGELPAKGSEVTANGKVIGTTSSATDGWALALLRLDRLEDAHAGNIPVMAGSSRLFPTRPSWARFDVPQFIPSQ
ncbi:MAG TPA: folate-binding protein [Aestuariivirgaceae bacterium]|jgi:hypothetical protein